MESREMREAEHKTQTGNRRKENNMLNENQDTEAYVKTM
jgi:hypothetical protein